MAATFGYGSPYSEIKTSFDPNPTINQMMQEDLRYAQQQQAAYYKHRYMQVPPDAFRGIDYGLTTECRCNPIPERLKNYYFQLLDYHRQAGHRPPEMQRTCCALRKLGIRY